MPASFCGIVGLKPTWGLVPYTGIIGLDASIDHAGPMTKNVLDAALLLQVIAGRDGLDDRQAQASQHSQIRYADEVTRFLRSADVLQPLRGFRIGILTEGFGLECSDPLLDAAVLSAAEKFALLGAQVKQYSIPAHNHGQMIWGVATFAGSYRQSALGCPQGRRQVYMTELIARARVGQTEFDAAGVGARNMMLSGMFLEKHYGPSLYARCKNLLRKLSVCLLRFTSLKVATNDMRAYQDDYDAAFQEFDILVTPTTPFAAPKHATHENPVDRLSSALGLTFNTSPLDATGHPAISIPVGFVPAKDDPSIKLPVGMQLIGRQFGELDLLKASAAWESRFMPPLKCY